MTRKEFEKLRDLPGKKVIGDLVFSAIEAASPILLFDSVRVENDLGIELRLNGRFNPLVPSICFNFRVMGLGPICRVEVNGAMHKGTRTHKHSLVNEDDPRLNLPNVVPRPDLVGKSARAVWMILCQQAKIEHEGKFVDP
jgi:hypothetical protein